MNKQLELEAEKIYPVNNTGSMFMPSRDQVNNSYKQEGFIAGATSKYVGKKKLEFAIEQLEQLKSRYDSLAIYRGTIKEYIDLQIKGLEQKLSEL